MAITTTEANNKLVKYTQEINREYVRENLFSPYMGESLNAIIRIRQELKSGGEQMNIPLVTKLTGRGKGSGVLVGNEEKIDNYGMRVWLDWARHAVATNKAQQQNDSADIFGEAKPLLSDWGKERQRDDIIKALMALPSESAPANLGTDDGETVNGILFESSTAAQRNTWLTSNSDRVLFGALTANAVSNVFATALATLDTTDDRLTYTKGRLMKRLAKQASPAIRPFKISNGREYFVCFCGTNLFRDLKTSLDTINKDARAREGNGMDSNPLFQDGDQLDDGVIYREVPEISSFVTNQWTLLGGNSPRVEPAFLCGQQAAVMAWGQMAKPTFRKEDDYGFVNGTGVEMAYGTSKVFKKHPSTSTTLKQWGVFTGFFAGPTD